MRFGVLGAGAIGAYVGARLQQHGEEVVFFARGAQLAALQTRGLTVVEPDRRETHVVRAEGDAAAIGPVDTILLGVKAHQIAGATDAVAAMCGPETIVVHLQNGIPWWYGYRHPIAADWTLESVDPGGAIARSLDAQRAIGALVYFAANIPEPGVVAHSSGMRIVVGEPANGSSARGEALAAALRGAGFDSMIHERIRVEIWTKLLGNLTFNPITALTHAFVGEAATDADVLALIREMMTEAIAVARALGDEPQMTVDERIAIAPRNGRVQTSMLQDREAHRPMEIAPIVGAVVELGQRARVPTPATRRVHALVALLDRVLAPRG